MNIHVIQKRGNTEARLDYIKQVYIPGMSSAQIAGAILRKFGDDMSRRAIIGLYYRYAAELAGYPLPPGVKAISRSERMRAKQTRQNEARRERRRLDRISQPDRPKPKQERKKRPPAPRVMSDPELYDATASLKTLWQLEAKECKWPITGAGSDTLFCAHESDGTYCQHHRLRSIGRGTISERNAADTLRRKA